VEALELWREKVKQQGAQISQLLCSDLEQFFSAAIRSAFINSTSLAARSSDEELLQLKARMKAEISRIQGELKVGLNEQLWLNARLSEEMSTPISEIPEVAALLESIAKALYNFLKAEQLQGSPTPYRLPVRFIDGKDLVTLTRGFWRALRQLRACEQELEESLAEEQKAVLKMRWDGL